MEKKDKQEVLEMETTNYALFSHTECEFYPCHKIEGKFNCLFCWCPLYALKDQCGGNFTYNKKGIKDCSKCKVPHSEKGYDYILSMFPKIEEITKMMPDEQGEQNTTKK